MRIVDAPHELRGNLEEVGQAAAGDTMSSGTRLARGALVGALVVAALAGCGSRGDLAVTNDSPDDVTVYTGDEEATVSSFGAVVLLDYGCTPGDVTVTFASDESLVLPGPVCPDQEILIGDGTAALRPASPNHP